MPSRRALLMMAGMAPTLAQKRAERLARNEARAQRRMEQTARLFEKARSRVIGEENPVPRVDKPKA